MSSTSGIKGTEQLTQVFSASFETRDIRFLKISIWEETLVPSSSIAPESTFEEDLNKLAQLLEDNEPAYILARLDSDGVEWLAISYVPDTATVRDKMLYASTRGALTKALGSAHFTDTIFATSKADLTPEAYAAHKKHSSAPPPLSRAEREMAEIREAERQASSQGGGTGLYAGTAARRNHVGPVGFVWAPEADEAVRALRSGQGNQLVVLGIEQATESLILKSSSVVSADELGKTLPSDEPSYAYYAWEHTHSGSRRCDIVFIYTCPPSSQVRTRMLYSSGALMTLNLSKTLLPDLAARKIETTDPTELDEAYLVAHLDLAKLSLQSGDLASAAGKGPNRFGEEGKSFARPKGPGRKR